MYEGSEPTSPTAVWSGDYNALRGAPRRIVYQATIPVSTPITSYSISESTTTVNEGDPVTFTITTTNVSDGTTLYYSINPVSGTVDASDFVSGSLTGSFTINSNSGSVVVRLRNDTSTEGTESFQLQVRTDSISGTIQVTSNTISITDSSRDPGGSPPPASANFKGQFILTGQFTLTKV